MAEQFRRGTADVVVSAKRLCAAVLLGVFSVLVLAAPTSPRQTSAEQVKTAMLLRFLQYTRWPDGVFASEDETLNLCIYGRNHWDKYLLQLQSRFVGQHQINVIPDIRSETVDRCHSVVVARDDVGTVRLIESIASTPVLTVGNSDDFLRAGGMITFLQLENRVRFSVDLGRARAVGLKLAPDMLAYAHEVLGSRP